MNIGIKKSRIESLLLSDHSKSNYNIITEDSRFVFNNNSVTVNEINDNFELYIDKINSKKIKKLKDNLEAAKKNSKNIKNWGNLEALFLDFCSENINIIENENSIAMSDLDIEESVFKKYYNNISDDLKALNEKKVSLKNEINDKLEEIYYLEKNFKMLKYYNASNNSTNFT